jgi:hypothetical protein
MESPWGTAKNPQGDMMEAEYNHLNHATWECKYHVVFTPKYRKKLLFGSRSVSTEGVPDRARPLDA